MKNCILFLLLALVPIVSLSAKPEDGYNDKDIIWVNNSLRLAYEMKKSKRTLKIRSVNDRKWRKFRKIGRNQYVDKNGRYIRFQSPYQFILKTPHKRKVLRFTRQYTRNQRSWRNPYTERSDYYDSRTANRRDNYQNRQRDGYSGLWQSSEGSTNLEINQSGKELKARIRPNGKWFKYKQDSIEENVFYDSKGNEYVFKDHNNCTWLSGEGRKKLSFYRN